MTVGHGGKSAVGGHRQRLRLPRRGDVPHGHTAAAALQAVGLAGTGRDVAKGERLSGRQRQIALIVDGHKVQTGNLDAVD